MKRIRKEIVIEAAPAKVWEHITNPERISRWLMPNTFEAVPGKAFRMDCGSEGSIDCVVREVVPPKKLVYTWTSKDLKITTTVEITLRKVRGGTRLVLIHSGWEKLPPREVDQGWDACLEKLVAQLKNR